MSLQATAATDIGVGFLASAIYFKAVTGAIYPMALYANDLYLATGSMYGWGNSATDATNGGLTACIGRSAAGVVQVGTTGVSTTLIGALKCATLVEANTAGSGAPNVITVGESRTLYTNEGATAENYHTLPLAAAGLTFTFYVQDTDGIRITANTGDTIRVAAGVSAAAGFVRSATAGAVVRLTAINATEWVAEYQTDTWTVDA